MRVRRTRPARSGASPEASQVSSDVQATLLKSFASAESVAEEYPQYSTQIIQAARESFVAGQDWAYLAGTLAVAVGAALVLVAFPRHDAELALLAEYATEDAEPAV
jgi:MFS transporter, DHA2 family, multidrug resistance protein